MIRTADWRFDPGLLATLLLAAAGTALALVVVAAEGPLSGEVWSTRQVQRLPGFLEPLADANRAVTTTWVVLTAGTAAALAFAVRRDLWMAVVVAALLVATPVCQAGIKDVVDRPRPTDEQVEVRAGYTSPSFPAGHVMSPAAVYGFGALLLWRTGRPRLRRGAVAVGAFLLLSCWANVYLGVHWPTDVLGGLLFGGALACLAAWLTSRPELIRVGQFFGR